MVKIFNKPSDFKNEVMEKGTYPARIYSVVNTGTVKTNFFNQDGTEKWQDKVRITFEFPTELKVFNAEKGEQPRVISKSYTMSFHEKATLKQLADACGIQARNDVETGFDYIEPEDFLGKACLVQIGVGVSQKGNDYNTIENVTSLMKGQVVPEQINPSMSFSVHDFNQEIFDSLPQFVKDEIMSSKEYKIINGTYNPDAEMESLASSQPF